MIHLLNSAMMPKPNGKYHSFEISKTEFSRRVQEADADGELKSYVGYRSTAEMLTQLTGVFIRENRMETEIEPGDTLLICRLKYRLADRPGRDVQPPIDDYEFRIVYFERDLPRPTKGI